ncbi:MAG: hypothetical protein IJL14_09665 [Selenomonadaceae bacterium]|nr:hypothetical protein [Selenomonadaceae bacterium]
MILLRDRQKIIENNFSEKNISYRDVVTAEKIFNRIESCDYVILRYKVFYEKEGNRVEDVYRADISAKKLPDTILVKIDNTEGEVEITDEIERELANPIIFTDWDEALNFFAEMRRKTDMRFKETDTPYADIFVAEKISDEFVTLKYAAFYKKETSWFEESCKENISAEKIPEDVRKKIDDAQGEVEITDEIERELAARVNSAVAD